MRIGKWIFVIWLAASAWALAAQPGATTKAGASSSSPAAQAGKKSTAKAKSKVASQRHKRSRKHQRDPFVSPLVKRERGRIKCTGTGRQCLFAGDLILQGVVKHSSGYIAVVASGKNTYFLRDEDPLADGKVERIGRDSIVLRQRTKDVFGRPVERKITKRLKNPAV
jgi:Tfp pilus assembly protein PilP